MQVCKYRQESLQRYVSKGTCYVAYSQKYHFSLTTCGQNCGTQTRLDFQKNVPRRIPYGAGRGLLCKMPTHPRFLSARPNYAELP